MAVDKNQNWTRARLIPVSGISSEKEAETRAASAVLAVLSVVRDLSVALFSPMGASRAARAIVETYTEPQFVVDGKKVRPDGVVRISYGKVTWTALVEIKTGDGRLEADQINAYWEIARQQNFDAVITISNEIAASPGSHPTEGLRARSNSKIQVHHISWTALLSTAVMFKVHRGVDDPEQAWLVGELIRYLEHSASGAMAFDDMGPNWVPVRDGARDGILRKTDDGVRDVALRSIATWRSDRLRRPARPVESEHRAEGSDGSPRRRSRGGCSVGWGAAGSEHGRRYRDLNGRQGSPDHGVCERARSG